jgi:hypothetical protein
MPANTKYMACLASLTLAVFTAQAQPVAEDHADPVIQAAELFEHARTERAACAYADAESWFRRAQKVVHENRMRSGETDAAGNLAARIEIEIAGLRDLQKRLDREQQAIERLIEKKQFPQARQRLQRAGFPACDSRFDSLKQLIAAAQYRRDHPQHCDSCRKVAKILVWTAVLGGVSYGGYWAYDKYGHPATPGSVPRSPSR